MVGIGGRAAARSILAFVGTAQLAQPAHAGAWSLPQGLHQWFATVSRETGDYGQAWRADDYVELGLGDGWGLNAKVETEIRIDTTYDDRSQYRVGLQKAFARAELRPRLGSYREGLDRTGRRRPLDEGRNQHLPQFWRFQHRRGLATGGFRPFRGKGLGAFRPRWLLKPPMAAALPAGAAAVLC